MNTAKRAGVFSGTEPSVKNKIRPDRVIAVYANQLKQACKTKPVIIGGLEACCAVLPIMITGLTR